MKLAIRRSIQAIIALAIVGTIIYAFLPKPIAVEMAAVTVGSLKVTVNEDGKTRVKERYELFAPLSGRLRRITLKPGDTIDTGRTVLAAIEPADPALLDDRALAQAEARVKSAEAAVRQAGPNVKRAQAALDYAEVSLERLRRLAKTNYAAQETVDAAEMLFRTRAEELKASSFAQDVARYELDLARAALIRARPASAPQPARSSEFETNGDGAPAILAAVSAADDSFEIRSPISGRVLRVFHESAGYVNPGEKLIEIGDPSEIEVEIDVLSSDAVAVRPGNEVALEQWGGERPLRAIVRLVEPSGFTKISALGVEEQRVNVIADLDEPLEVRAALGDGYRVEAKIVVWEGKNVVKVPTGAIFRDRKDSAIYVVKEGRAALRHITPGRRNGIEAEIIEGLAEGEQVIDHPSDLVKDGVKVKARE